MSECHLFGLLGGRNFAAQNQKALIMTETYNINSDGSRQYESIMRMLRQVIESQTEIKGIISDLKVMRDALVGNIHLDSMTLELVLDVSDSTLYRWRNSPPPNNLPYYVRDNGFIYYDFDEVLKALRKGQLVARGFNRMKAIDNMIKYRNDMLRAKDGGSWLVSD